MSLAGLEHVFLSPREGPRLVFLHEGLGSISLWRDFPRQLCEATGLGGFVYSRQSYGKSAKAAPLDWPVRYMHDEAERLHGILREAGIDDAILVGHSDGASIALIFAGTGGHARALLLEAPHVFAEPVALASIAKAKEMFAAGGLRERLARHHQDVDAAFFRWNDAWLHPDFTRWNLEPLLPSVRAPVLLVQGEDDEYGTLAQLDAIERGCPGRVERVVLPACGHSPHRDQPGRTLEAMRRFVAGVV